jgi:ATP-dependent DNA helicase PIF1
MSIEELTLKQLEAFEYIKSGKNVFITGPAGCGKSFIINYFVKYYKSLTLNHELKLYITSTTGISSLLIGGTTIHSFAGIGFGDKSVDYYIRKINNNEFLLSKWCLIKILIIDEISMLHPDILIKLEEIARKVRRNNKKFGGIQIILSGDFLQLPAVKSNLFCFEIELWDLLIDKTFYFDEIMRQKNKDFQNVLNKIRIGVVDDNVKEILNSCLNKNLTNEYGIKPTLLFSKKFNVENVNNLELEKLLDNNEINYNYKSKYKYVNINEEYYDTYKKLLNSNIDVPDEIILSIGTQVMLTVNNLDTILANGSRGIIIGFSNKKLPIVQFLNGIIKEINYYKWPLEQNLINKTKPNITKKQLPLILAWALSIHRLQGSSIDYAEIDIGTSIFEFGQSYVALSRVKTLDGLSITDISYKKIKSHPHVILYYENLKELELELKNI